jgi:hypothetical protein
MRILLMCAFSAALFLTPTFATAAGETFEWSGGAGAHVLSVSHVAGKVNVAVGGDEVVVRATKKCKDADFLAAVRITVEEEGDAVVVDLEYPEDVAGKPEVIVDFDISVPAGLARAEVASATGEVKIAGVAEAAVGTATGSVDISGAYKEAAVNAASGDVVVDNAGGPTERVAVDNVSGNVTLRLELPAAGAGYEVSSVSGRVELELAGGADNYDITVSAVTGNVNSAFPLKSSGGLVGRSYSGRAGAATNKIAVSTVSGSVEISAAGK